MRCTLTMVHPTGVRVAVLVSDIDAVDDAIAVLLAKGYRPFSSGDGYQRTPDGRVLCSKHQAIMQKRAKQGDEWFSHRVQAHGRELWCRGYPTGKPDDGYLVG